MKKSRFSEEQIVGCRKKPINGSEMRKPVSGGSPSGRPSRHRESPTVRPGTYVTNMNIEDFARTTLVQIRILICERKEAEHLLG